MAEDTLMIKPAVVVIPVYLEEINQFEQISLEQAFQVLGAKYEIVAVAPNGLYADYLKRFSKIERFDDRFFCDIVGYSKLLTSIDFYNRFADYEYMLVYQLDAFVFSDRLEEFCSKGYSYIGAVVGNVLWGHLDNHIGNGGFSLRRVGSFIEILKNRQYYVDRIKKSFDTKTFENIMENEDQFWAYCAQISSAAFTVPDKDCASDFSIEANINYNFKMLGMKLPFGCHRWYKANFEVWQPIISSYGYEMDESEILRWTQYGTEYIRASFYKNYDGNLSVEMKNNMPLNKQKPLSIWGAGLCGEHCYRILKDCYYRIERIFDKTEMSNIWGSGSNTVYPDEVVIRRSLPIVISTYKYKNDIMQELIAWGLEKDKDFFCWTEIETKWLEINGLNVEIM